MRDDVCILLNDREPTKRQMADELEEQLRLRRLAVSRIEPVGILPPIILERAPRVIVLDFVLGDVGTALDILSAVEESNNADRIRSILWTDEPSVSVAAQAMKLGAFDFIPLHTTGSLEKVLTAIEACLGEQHDDEHQSSQASAQQSSPLVAQSASFVACLHRAKSLGVRGTPIIVLQGPRGCGRNSVAAYIHGCQSRSGLFTALDLDTWIDPASALCGAESEPHLVPLLYDQTTVFVDHVEFDLGELLSAVEERRKWLWKPGEEHQPRLIVGTNCDKTATAWTRLLSAERIDIPSLQERSEDIWPLVQATIQDIKLQPSVKLQLSPEMVRVLGEWEWPGNVRQLRAAVAETALGGIHQSAIEAIADDWSFEGFSTAEEHTMLSLLAAKKQWEAQELATPLQPERLEVLRALEKSQGNLRIAAALLGTGLPQIKSALQQEGSRTVGGSRE